MASQQVMKWKDCLAHYAKTVLPPPNSKGANEAKMPMARFCGVSTPTIQRWVVGGAPEGLPLLKLLFFLDGIGYKVSELLDISRQSKSNYKLAEMLAYDVMNLEEAQKFLDYANSQSVYQVAFGKSGMGDLRIEVVDAEYKHISDVIDAKKKEFGFIVEDPRSKKVESVPSSPEPSTTKSTPTVKDENSSTCGSIELTSIAYMILAITPILERFSNQSTKEERQDLRKLLGSGTMNDLSKFSSRLCSEKAHEIV